MTLAPWELAAVLGSLFVAAYLYKPHEYPLPPGPRKLPVVGNLLDIPSTHPWKVYAEWGKKYS